jgi:hypothetical protein
VPESQASRWVHKQLDPRFAVAPKPLAHELRKPETAETAIKL